jgi:glutaredoxin
MKTKKSLNNFTLYSIVLLFFVLTLFILSVNLKFFYAYGIEENAIFFGRSFDISSNNGSSELPQISSQGNNVYVVWQDNTSGNYDIYFTHSSDNGNRFAQARSLSNNSGSSELPQISSQGNNVYVVWQDNTSGNYDIYFKPSTTNGTKFKSLRNLSNNNGTSQVPQIVTQGTNVYVVWQDNTRGNYDIFFKRSPNKGTGFKSVILDNSNGTSQQPQISSQGKNVYVVWQDNTSGNYDIYFQQLISNDTKFKSVRNLSNNNASSELPHVAVLGNEIYVIWRDNNNGTSRIFFKHGHIDNSTGTVKFGSVDRLHHNGNVSQAKIARGSEFFYGVWSSQLNKSNASTIEFYPFMLFEDYSGDAIPLTSLSSNEILSSPDIAIDKSDVFLVWENKTTGNGDIFFKKLSTNFFDRDG